MNTEILPVFTVAVWVLVELESELDLQLMDRKAIKQRISTKLAILTAFMLTQPLALVFQSIVRETVLTVNRVIEKQGKLKPMCLNPVTIIKATTR